MSAASATAAGDGVDAPRLLFCGDRPVSARMVEMMIDDGAQIVAVGLNEELYASRPDSVRRAAGVASRVFTGPAFFSPSALKLFESERPHLGICCGFASVLPAELLRLPSWGWVNVHRSYLPYNRGWAPLEWALIDGTPAGVSLHVMTSQLDSGAVIAQAEVPIEHTDTIQSLGQRADAVAMDMFRSHWPRLRVGDLRANDQEGSSSTYHSKIDLERARKVHLNEKFTLRKLLRTMQAFSQPGFPAFFEEDGRRYALHLDVEEMDAD